MKQRYTAGVNCTQTVMYCWCRKQWNAV